MTEGEYHCERPFGIDNGELGDATQQECFVLGYELAQIDKLLTQGDVFNKTVHATNRGRIEMWLKRQGKEYRFTWPDDDVSESWIYLRVEAGE